MPHQESGECTVKDAVSKIIPYLVDTSKTASKAKAIYFNGWYGLAASAMLRDMADNCSPLLRDKFDKILHIDCSSWKSRRALQRAIVDELKLPQWASAALDRQDEEDDFSGVREGSRQEIDDVAKAICLTLRDLRCLVLFHNGSNHSIDLADFGLPQFERFSATGSRVLWTFRGRLRLFPPISGNVDNSHLFLAFHGEEWDVFLEQEAREIALYARKLCLGVNHRITKECCLYLLQLSLLSFEGIRASYPFYGGLMGYNWATHASNYWVCDGIVEGDKNNQAWEVARAVHQYIHIEDCNFLFIAPYIPQRTYSFFVDSLKTRSYRWVLASNINMGHKIPRFETTSFFLGYEIGSIEVDSSTNEIGSIEVGRSTIKKSYTSVPNTLFHQAAGLRVLKLYRCTFNFLSPPFQCCQNLRFLGLDNCKGSVEQTPLFIPQEEDGCTDRQGGERTTKYGPAFAVFQRLWVLDMCYTNWELASPLREGEEEMATNIREVHIRKGKMWHDNLPWWKLQNLHKLCIVEPTCSWETGKKDEFKDMLMLESLHLSDSTIQVLPSFSGATRLKTLVLDGCVGLESIGPRGLPPLLESFCLDAGAGKDRQNKPEISHINLAGCSRFTDFKVSGPLPKLEELDLSQTSVRILDLKEVVEVQHLQRIILMGCKKLRSIVWPEKKMKQLRLLWVDTREEATKTSHLSFIHQEQKEYCHAFVAVTDMRFLQSLLVLPGIAESPEREIDADRLMLSLYFSSTSEDGDGIKNRYSTGLLVRSPLYKLLMFKTCYTYSDVNIEQMTSKLDSCGATKFHPQDVHIEIGQGAINTNVVSEQGIRATIIIMNNAQSLHVHDNSTITSVIPRNITVVTWPVLKWCCVERCPELDTLFHVNKARQVIYAHYFYKLETLWASDLLKARCIWRIEELGVPYFKNLRAIHLHFCPRLTLVLSLSLRYLLMSLETLDIVCCGDLRQVFPVGDIEKNRTNTLDFPKLKSLYLHELSKLQHICEAKMYAPSLETIRIRGCWGLRRLPSTDHLRQGGCLVAVDCEKDWWDKLEWDGLSAGHDPSFFVPRHSAYYKKKLVRGSVLQ